MDSQGNIYIADKGNRCVRMISVVSNIITTFAGVPGSSGITGIGGLATTAKMVSPSFVLVDIYSGNVLISDTSSNIVSFIWVDDISISIKKTIFTFSICNWYTLFNTIIPTHFDIVN